MADVCVRNHGNVRNGVHLLWLRSCGSTLIMPGPLQVLSNGMPNQTLLLMLVVKLQKFKQALAMLPNPLRQPKTMMALRVQVLEDVCTQQTDDLTAYGLHSPCTLQRTSERVSLTIRRVPRVRKGLLRL